MEQTSVVNKLMTAAFD